MHDVCEHGWHPHGGEAIFWEPVLSMHLSSGEQSQTIRLENQVFY